MSAPAPHLPADLQRAADAAAALDGVSVLLPWSWDTDAWVLRCRLVREGGDAGPVPKATDWCVVVRRYPWGSIQFMPAGVHSIEDTFWHQAANDACADKPWRTGALCLTTPGSVLGRLADGHEPMDADSRLPWHFRRALGWLQLANEGALQDDGDPFEMPPLPNLSSSAWPMAYIENLESYRAWCYGADRYGFAKLGVVPYAKAKLVLQWLDVARKPASPVVWWGSFADSSNEAKDSAIWVRLDQIPVMRLAQLPRTWGELVQASRDQGLDIQAIVERLAPMLRDGRRHYLLVGAPIPHTTGGPPALMQWLCLWLPSLSHGTKQTRGFRKGNEQGYIRRDRAEVLTPRAVLDWVATENWDRAQRATRGVLPSSVRQQRVALIGAGALGSLLAENLVRAGVEDLALFDHDQLAIGNLVRHTLTLEDLGQRKSVALAERLNSLTPQGRVVGVSQMVQCTDSQLPEMLANASVVLDASGSEEVLCALDRGCWPEPVLFLSASVSWRARHLYLFVAQGHSFPADAFEAMLEPWAEQLRGDDAGEAEIWEGVGCWHPVWPGRYDHLASLAGCAIGIIETAVTEPPCTPMLYVLERTADSGVTVNSTCWDQVVT